MNTQDLLNCEKLRTTLEGREAILVDKGVLRVRVSNIQCDVALQEIDLQVEEIVTLGLERGLLHGWHPNDPAPLRLEIGGGHFTTFSEHTFAMGYGGWHLFFAPEIVSGLVKMASNWPTELEHIERYNQTLDFLARQNAYEESERVFHE